MDRIRVTGMGLCRSCALNVKVLAELGVSLRQRFRGFKHQRIIHSDSTSVAVPFPVAELDTLESAPAHELVNLKQVYGKFNLAGKFNLPVRG